jgi:hypothetical protein
LGELVTAVASKHPNLSVETPPADAESTADRSAATVDLGAFARRGV